MSLMVACADAEFERHCGLIDALSSKVFRISERPGDAAKTKLVNNLLAGINLAGAAEVMAMAQQMGLRLDKTLDVIEQSSGQSWIGSDRLRPRGHGSQQGNYAPTGDTVNVAARLEAASKELGWTIVASSAVLADAGEGLQTGGMTSLGVGGKNGFVDVAEITGLAASERAAEVRDAVRINSEISARAVKGSLQSELAVFKGYRLTRKIGSGGMTELFLAMREADGLPVVLKVLNASLKATAEHLARFIHEYALLSSIEHPHVIRIYTRVSPSTARTSPWSISSAATCASEITAGPDQQRVVDIISQTAQALDAIHARGIVHRDVKPGNIMLRLDGSVALADFGIAKSMLEAEPMALTQARCGDVVGTPYYLSPEQVSGKPITPKSDLYSLGVMMFEIWPASARFARSRSTCCWRGICPRPRHPCQRPMRHCSPSSRS